MKIVQVLLFVSVVVVLGYFGHSWRRDHQEAERRQKSLHDELGNLGVEVQNLRKESRTQSLIAMLRTGPTPQPPTAPDNAQQRQATTDAGTSPVRDPVAKLSEEMDKARDTLEQRLEKEPVDATWSVATQRQISEAIETKVPGTSLVNTFCASTLCRVVLKHTTAEGQARLGSIIATAEPFDQGTFYHVDHDTDPPQTTLFITRQGVATPNASR